MFENREDAGRRLAMALEKYRRKDAVVLGIASGGIIVAHQVAKYLEAELDVVVAKRLPYFNNPHAGFGSVSEEDSVFIFPGAYESFNEETISRIIQEQQNEVCRKVGALRSGNPLPNIEGKTVIIVDDGISAGSNMSVCITFCRNKNAAKIVAAAPVSGIDNAQRIQRLADDVCILEVPEDFCSVSNSYENFQEVTDRQIIKILRQWEYEKFRAIGH